MLRIKFHTDYPLTGNKAGDEINIFGTLRGPLAEVAEVIGGHVRSTKLTDEQQAAVEQAEREAEQRRLDDEANEAEQKRLEELDRASKEAEDVKEQERLATLDRVAKQANAASSKKK